MRLYSFAAFSLGAFAIGGCAAAAATDAPDDSSPPSVAGVVPAVVGWRTNSDGTGSIAIVNADGSNYRALTTTSGTSGIAQTSYAGRFLVYSDGADASHQQLLVIDQTGKKRTLVAASSQIASASSPSISPDSQWVYFRAVPASNTQATAIWRVHLDGTGLENVGRTRTTASGAASISPDGRTMLETTSDSVIFTAVATGATHGERVRCSSAQYSPDGLHVSCVAAGELLVYDAQFVQSPRRLGDGTYSDAGSTDWTPDGSKILVTSVTKGPELVSYADGSVISANLGTSYKAATFVH